MARIISISVTQKEYDELKKHAQGVPLAQYIKDIVLPKNNVRRWYPVLLGKVAAMGFGQTFSLRTLMGANWAGIPKGVKLALGRLFYQSVAADNVANVQMTNAGGNKVHRYQKIKMRMNPQANILHAHKLLLTMQTAVVAVLHKNRRVVMSSNEIYNSLPSDKQAQLSLICAQYSPRYACGQPASYVGSVAAIQARIDPHIVHHRNHMCPVLKRLDDAFEAI